MNEQNYEIIKRDDEQSLVLRGIASEMFVTGMRAHERWTTASCLGTSDPNLNQALDPFDGKLQVDTMPGKLCVEWSSAHVSCLMTIHDDSRLGKLRTTRSTMVLNTMGRYLDLSEFQNQWNTSNVNVAVTWSDFNEYMCGRLIVSRGNTSNTTDPSQKDRVLRRKPKPSRFEMNPAVRIVTTPELFRSFLNASAKGGMFCVAADRGKYAVFNGDNLHSVSNFPKLKKKYKLSSAVGGQGSAGTYHKILYDTLYRRKQECLGMLTTLDQSLYNEATGLEFSFGLSMDNRLFVELRSDKWSCSILFNSLYDAPSLKELPELTVMGGSPKRQGSAVAKPIEPLVELSSDEEAIVSLWKTSSDDYRDARNAKRTEDRKLMFTDHILVLAMSGRGPTEDELNLLQRL